MIRWWKNRCRLRRIADLEDDLGLSEGGRWWSLERSEWYTMIDGGVSYHMPELEKSFRGLFA